MAQRQNKRLRTEGATATKVSWNKQRTKKWEMTYKLVEVRPPKRAKKTAAPTVSKEAVKKAKQIVKKSSKKGRTRKRSSGKKSA